MQMEWLCFFSDLLYMRVEKKNPVFDLRINSK